MGDPFSVGRWGSTDDLGECAAERAQTAESDCHADLGHTHVVVAQEEHRSLHPPALKVAVWRLAEDSLELSDEVGSRHVGECGELADVERLSIPAVHVVAGAQEPKIHRFGPTVHQAIVSREHFWRSHSAERCVACTPERPTKWRS
jgi:hypothetical protein